MNQYDFDKLLVKYLEGKCSPEEIEILDEWSKKQLSNVKHVQQHYEAPKTAYNEIWRKINENINPSFVSKVILFAKRKLVIAASLLFILSITYSIIQLQKDEDLADEIFVHQDKIITLSNYTSQVKEITLPDSSRISLQPNSTVKYDKNFGVESRTVILEGECFFDIKRDESIPFLVYSEHIVTEVLGTSFIVKTSGDNKITEVEVISGLVNVYAKKRDKTPERSENLLKANHKLIYDNESNQIVKTLVENPIPIKSIKNNQPFLFIDTPLQEVVQRFEQYYGMEIHILDRAVNKCTFTGDISDENPLNQIKLICQALNVEIEIVGTKIIITGKGCE